VGLEHFTDRKVNDLKIRELIKKIKMYVHPDVENDPDFASIVTVRLRDGREYSYRVAKARGRPSVPLSGAELHAKYRNCAREVLCEEDIERSLNLVENLEALEDITLLVNTFLLPSGAACRATVPSLVKELGE
jgi:2-methylcitrate dehydratase PrpD